MQRFILNLSRWILGALFIFSGFVKGIDPWGLQYKFTDYFHAFGWDSLSWLSAPASFLLPLAEFLIGVGLISNVMISLSALMALLFMVFFTPLTLYLALVNPVTDCGCFGDAWIITNWQTFYKNVILLSLAIFVFVKRGKIESYLPKGATRILAAIMAIGYFGVVVWSYLHEPIIDFRPYKVGVNIPDAMKIPEGAPIDVYQHNFYYKNLKTNKVEEFTEDNYPWQDTINYKFESMGEPKLISKGFTPPIHDFEMQTEEGNDVKDFFFDDPKFTFIMVAYNLEKTNIKQMEKINELAMKAKKRSMMFVCLTATTGEKLEQFKTEHQPAFDFLFGDEITLKTIIRSNPGLLLTRQGTILAKWHYNDLPTIEEVMKKYTVEMIE